MFRHARICEKGRLSLAAATLLLTLRFGDAAWAPGGESRAEDLTISLVTFGPGGEIPEYWGHSALAVVDNRLEKGRLYNYGAVDFSDGFLLRFLAGRMEFLAEEGGIQSTYAIYRQSDRDIRVQELDLSPEQALVAANTLAVNVLPENAKYLYHHYDDNCSTRPRDIVDRALGGALSRATTTPARMSLRDHTRRYSQVLPPLSVWLDYMQNDQLDRPITQREEAFLPDELERQLDALVVDGKPVVRKKAVVYATKTRPAVPAESPRWSLWLGLISAAAGAFVLVLSRRSGKRAPRLLLGGFLAFEGLFFGICGLFLFVLGTFTNNLVTHHNENLLLVSPFTLALLPLGVMLMWNSPRAAKGLKWTSLLLAVGGVLAVALKVLPAFDQQNWNIIAFVLPLSLATAAAFWRPHAS